MGKASSAKKVARAAGLGGGRARGGRRPPWMYYGAILAIVVLGVIGTWVSRDRRVAAVNAQGSVPPTVGTVWNEGYAIYACGKWLPPIKTNRDPQGITTSEPGIINIHPFVKAAAGKNATLGKFASAVGLTLNAGELREPGGRLYLAGDTCEGGPGNVYVKEFPFIGATGVLENVNPDLVRLQNQALLTIAFVPASDKDKIPSPPQYVVNNLKKLAASTTTTTTTTPSSTTSTSTPGTSPTTAAGSTSKSSSSGSARGKSGATATTTRSSG